MFNRPVSPKDDRSRALQRLREWGYQDGYAGKEAVTKAAAYQEAWRRGMEARRQDGLA